MATTTPSPKPLFALSGLLLALAMLSTCILGFSYFAVGYFFIDPIMLALLVTSLLSIFWLTIGIATKQIVLAIPVRNPLFILWCTWLGWQALATLTSNIPIRSLLGPSEQGEGLAWYLMASIMMIQLSILWPCGRNRIIILSYSFFLITLLALLHFITDADNNLLAVWVGHVMPPSWEETLLPYIWPDYLGYMIGWWWIAARLTQQQISRPLFTLQTLIALFVLIASSNRGAVLLVSIGILGSALIPWISHHSKTLFKEASLGWRRLAMTSLLLPLFWLLICASPNVKVDYEHGISQSIPTRVLLNHISLAAIADEPSRLLWGPGWSSFQDDFFKHALVRDIHVYRNGIHDPNWSLIRGHNYHTHNTASEILLSLGIVGLALWMAMPLLVIAKLPGEYFWRITPALVAMTMLQHWWFALPQALPLQALCWFCIFSHMTTQSTPMGIRFRTPTYLLTLAIITTLGWGALSQYQAIRYTQKAINPFANGEVISTQELDDDIVRGGDLLRSIMIRYTKRLAVHQENVTPKHIELFSNFIEAAKHMADDPHSGAYNAATIFYAYNVALSTLHDPIFMPILQDAISSYEHYALLHTERAPKREDIIAPYLMALDAKDTPRHKQRLLDFTQSLLAIEPSHRSALWLSGKLLAEQPSYHTQGIEMMKTALALGAYKVYGINNSERDALSRQPVE